MTPDYLWIVIVGALFAFFAAMGIGANDVANAYATAVGSKALTMKQAVISATSALEATQVGYKVGTRNVVDLLQAEKNLYSAEKNLANAKYDYILANLRLALAAGTISPSDIVEINNLLK